MRKIAILKSDRCSGSHVKRILCEDYKCEIVEEHALLEKDAIMVGGYTDIIIPNSMMMYSESLVNALKTFESMKGNLFFLLDHVNSESNVNFFLEQYSFTLNDDQIIRSHYSNELLPNEVILESVTVTNEASASLKNCSIYFNEGCSLNYADPSFPIVLSDKLNYPSECSIVAGYKGKGKILVVSVNLFTRGNIGQQDNGTFLNALIQVLLSDEYGTNITQKTKQNLLCSNVEDLAHRFLYQLDMPEKKDDFVLGKHFLENYSKAALEVNNIKKKRGLDSNLGLIKPRFETPFPPLACSIFPPVCRTGRESHLLEKFNLDYEFENIQQRVDRLVSKYDDTSLASFLYELFKNESSGKVSTAHEYKEKLHQIFKKMLSFKSIS